MRVMERWAIEDLELHKDHSMKCLQVLHDGDRKIGYSRLRITQKPISSKKLMLKLICPY